MADDDKNKQLAEYSGAAKVFAAPANSSYPRFDRENFGVWKALMECGLRANELWDAVDPGGNAFKKEGAEHRKDRQAASAIYSVMPMDVLQHLIAKETAKEAWDTLKLMFEGHTRVKQANLQTLLRNYETLVMGDNESVDAFASRVATLVNRIRALAIEQCVDLETLSIDDLVGCYKAHDERMRYSLGDGRNYENVMLTRAQRLALDSRRGGEGSSSNTGQDRAPKEQSKKNAGDGAPKKKKFDKRKIKCHNCGIMGHFKSECKKPPKEKALLAKGGDDGDMMLMVEVCELMDKDSPAPKAPATEVVTLIEEAVYLHDKKRMNTSRHVWYLDTGASNHMTGDKDQFSELRVSVGRTVRFSDGRTVDIAGRGTLLFELKNGGHKVLTDVYYIPKLKSSIICLGQLEERGCKIVLEDGYLWGYDRQRMLIMKVQRSPNRLYVLNLDRVDPVCLLSSMDDSAWKWHARYGHLNFQALRQLGQKEMTKDQALQAFRIIKMAAEVESEAKLKALHIDDQPKTSSAATSSASGAAEKKDARRHAREAAAADVSEGTYGTAGSSAGSARPGGVVPSGGPEQATPARGSRGTAPASPCKSLSAGGVSSMQQSSPRAAPRAHEVLVREGHVREDGTPVLADEEDIARFKLQMKELFKMSDQRLLTYYLGIEVHQKPEGITLCQEAYANKILESCSMEDWNPSHVPMEPRLKFSKRSQAPAVDTTEYRSVVGSLRYIKGTTNFGCVYLREKRKEMVELLGYSDSDLAGDIDDRKSTSGMAYFLGRSIVSWLSQKQKVVALSSCEAEYIAAATAAGQGVWLERLLGDLTDKEPEGVVLYVDNKSTIALCKNPVHHDRSKHIDIRYHYIRHCVEEGKIEVNYICTDDQLADILTKSLGRQKFTEMRGRIGVQAVK
ncbi:uncharacterized protein [Aegilops tauschii subsp. strangulata]|uniref:uncharacterized protein n=1 Tax=Aegilops tauschii subsp. strangulata TaxID=200361 RepID=UPI003CC8B0E4